MPALDELISNSKRLVENGDVNNGQRLARQAVNRANVSKDDILQKGVTTEADDAKQLADWFGDLAFIFHKSGDSCTAAKCFYTATVFDRDWTIDEHGRVAEVLWDGLVFKVEKETIQQQNQTRELVRFLRELDEFASIAEQRERWLVCLVITTDIDRVYKYLVLECQLKLDENIKLNICHNSYRTARCALEMGNHNLVRMTCQSILTELANNSDSEALGILARSFVCTGNYDIAAQYCNQAITNSKTEDERLQLFELLDGIERNLDKADQDHLEAAPKLPESLPQQMRIASNFPTGPTEHDPYNNNNSAGTEIQENMDVLYQRTTLNDDNDSDSDDNSSDNLESVGNNTEEETESDSGDSSEEWSSLYYPSTSVADSSEAAFYEQSCRQYLTQNENDEVETNQTELLQNGLQLSETYLVQHEDKHPSVQNREPFYPEMLCEVVLKDRLLKQPQVFKRGILQIDSSHVAKCIPIESQDDASVIEISGRSKANQAFNDDEVVVELLDSETDNNEQRFGRVIGVLKRNPRKDVNHPVFICTLDDMESHLVRPMCKTVPKIHILNKQVTEKHNKEKRYKIEVYKYDEKSGSLKAERDSVKDVNPGDREKYVFLVVFIKWSRFHVYPIGAIIDRLPCGDTIENGLTILNLQHQIPALYTKKTVKRVESIRSRYTDDPTGLELQGRLDLTHLTTFTIDPAGSRDLDDALSIEKYEEGYKVGVHIADVSHFVEKGDHIDKEAEDRATSFYPGTRRPRHMIPEPLSTNICSLLPNRVRLTLSVFFYLGSNGKPIQMEGNNFEMKLSYIKSRQQFEYAEVQRIIEAEKSDHPYSREVKQLFNLAKTIRRNRLGNALFALDISKDDDTDAEEANEAHYMVEEFMIMANKKVADVLLRKYPKCVPLRCQKAPSQEDIENFTKKHGVYVNVLLRLQDRTIGGYLKPCLDNAMKAGDGKEIVVGQKTWSLIKRCDDRSGRYMRTDAIHPFQCLANSHWMSIQEHAMYRCSGSLKGYSSGRHFDLDLYPYTHFTSPIRRYCDLIVHRLLKALIMQKPVPYKKEEVENVCAHMNAKGARAKEFHKGFTVLEQAVELRKQQKLVSCFVDDVSDRGLVYRAPSMSFIGQKEIAFSLMGVGIKPHLQMDTDGGHNKVTTTWVMRLYNFNIRATNEPDIKGETFIVNPYQEIRFISVSQWCRTLKSCIEERTSDFKKYLNNSKIEHKNEGEMDVTTECKDITLMQPHTKFSMSFSHGQIVKFQMTSVEYKGVLNPCPMLYSMTDNVKICFLHRTDPVLYLSQYTTDPTQESYTSVKVYLQRWLPLIEMEAAIGAVGNEESCIINDVLIKFQPTNNTGKFKLPAMECEVRNIDFSGTQTPDQDGSIPDDPSSSHDWLCLRCPLTRSSQGLQTVRSVLEHDSFWVGHAGVTSVKKTEQNLSVCFQVHCRSPLPPPLARHSTKFQIEILRKSEVDRRTESFLKKLPSMPDSLAARIALKSKKHPVPPLEESRIKVTFDLKHDLVIPPGENVKYPLPANNFKQQEAIDKALLSRFTLIQGPPGTGKTYTGIKLICLFNKINRIMGKKGQGEKQVLFCGPSNKSVDLVARWMKNRLGEHLRPKFVRVYGRSIEAIDFPIPGRTFLTKKSTRNQKADDDLKEVALHHLIRKEGPQGNRYAKEINIMDKKFKNENYTPQSPEVIREYVHKVREASIEEIRKYDVIICTTAVGSNPKVLEASDVYQVIVDEAGMCPEPQCLVPIIATKAEQVVLIGDHKQLRPIIMCKEAATLGLEQSLFERYVSAENSRFTMLVQQYRMHPKLCRFPSNQFYKGQLVTERGRWFDRDRPYGNIWQRPHDGSFPHILMHVEGEEKVLTVSTEDGNEQSKSNTEEVQQVVRVFRYLINEGIPDAEINIMSQYNAQCSEIKRALKEENFENFQVSTVVSSQGGEWDYVIFSTARSMPDYKIEKNPTKGWCKQNLGFITDQNQINVALTRARKGLVIIGNRNLLQCDDVWKKLVKRFSDTDSIKTPEQFPPRERTRQEKMAAAQKQSYRRYGDEMFEQGSATSYEGPIDIESHRNIGQRYNRNRNPRPQHRAQHRPRNRPQSMPQNRSQNRP